MNAPFQNNYPDAHHENRYKKILLIVALLLGLTVLTIIAYQVMVLKKTLPTKDKQARDLYFQEQLQQSQQFFANLPKPKPLSEEEKKQILDFFKTNQQATFDDAQTSQLLEEQKKLQEASFQEWKQSKGL